VKVLANLKYTKEHEWVKLDGTTATIGITDFAQGELGDIVFIELPEIGLEVKQMGKFGTIEAVKAVSDMYSPVSGKIVQINPALDGGGWMVKIQVSNPSEVNNLLDAKAYENLLKEH
jgi:glycine cleavage system H protein